MSWSISQIKERKWRTKNRRESERYGIIQSVENSRKQGEETEKDIRKKERRWQRVKGEQQGAWAKGKGKGGWKCRESTGQRDVREWGSFAGIKGYFPGGRVSHCVNQLPLSLRLQRNGNGKQEPRRVYDDGGGIVVCSGAVALSRATLAAGDNRGTGCSNTFLADTGRSKR